MSKDYTPEEIAEMHDRNENFIGKRADFEKVRLYYKIRAELERLDGCTVGGYEPKPHEQNALLWLDMPDLIMMDGEAAGRLARAISMADRLSISASGGKVRFAFGVERVWKD